MDRIIRLADIVISVLVLVITLPFFIIIIPVIKFSSKGPVFFKQERVGRNAKIFNIIKLRTMHTGSDRHLLLTTENDKRITNVGKFLRKYKLDELPQFYNVLKGNMSIVGPRPDVKKYVDRYSDEQRIVLGLKPGITDYASIRFSNENEMLSAQSDPEKYYLEKILPEKIKLNMLYINQKGLKSYFIIIYLTICKVLHQINNEIIKSGRLNLSMFLFVVFTLPINRFIFTISLWPWILSWIIEGGFKEKFSLMNLRNNLFALVFISGIYLIEIISLLWTQNIPMGFHNLGTQTSLIIFPLFIGFIKPGFYTRVSIKAIFSAFILGTLTVTLYLLVKSILYTVSVKDGVFIFNPSIGQGENVFFYSEFSTFMHPTYFGMMVLFSASLCFIDLKMNLVARKYNYLKLTIGIFFLLVIFLISSRSIILATIVVIIGLLINNYSRRKSLLLGAIAITVVIIIISVSHPRLRYLVVQYSNSETIEEVESINERGILWFSSYQIIRDNLFLGVGIGDVEDDLCSQLKKNGHDLGTLMNAHNQFLEYWLTSGVLLFIVFLVGLTAPVFLHKNGGKIYYVSFVIICMFIFMFESTLRRFAGVAFFSIFYIILTRLEFPGIFSTESE